MDIAARLDAIFSRMEEISKVSIVSSQDIKWICKTLVTQQKREEKLAKEQTVIKARVGRVETTLKNVKTIVVFAISFSFALLTLVVTVVL